MHIVYCLSTETTLWNDCLDVNLVELPVVEELLDSSGSPSGVSTLQVLINSLKFNREVLRKRADVVSCDLKDMLPSVLG